MAPFGPNCTQEASGCSGSCLDGDILRLRGHSIHGDGNRHRIAESRGEGDLDVDLVEAHRVDAEGFGGRKAGIERRDRRSADGNGGAAGNRGERRAGSADTIGRRIIDGT